MCCVRMSQSRLKPPIITVALHILTAALQVTSDCEGIEIFLYNNYICHAKYNNYYLILYSAGSRALADA